jgi:hypothetical protein
MASVHLTDNDSDSDGGGDDDDNDDYGMWGQWITNFEVHLHSMWLLRRRQRHLCKCTEPSRWTHAACSGWVCWWLLLNQQPKPFTAPYYSICTRSKPVTTSGPRPYKLSEITYILGEFRPNVEKHLRRHLYAYSLPIWYFSSPEYVANYVAALCALPTLRRVQPFPLKWQPLASPSRHYSHQPSAEVALSTCYSCNVSSGGQTLSPYNFFLILRTLCNP